MFAPTRFLIIAMILMPACAPCSGVRGEEAPRPLSQTIVEMQLMETCQVFFEGDPISLTVVLKNTSERNLGSLYFAFGASRVSCSIHRCDGVASYSLSASVYITPEPPGPPSSDGERYDVALLPRGTSVFLLDLLKTGELPQTLPPGEYEVSLRYRQSGTATEKGWVQELHLKSNEITIRVFPRQNNQPKPQIEFSHPSDVQLRLVQPEHAFYQGEPIMLKARLANTSKQDMGTLYFDMAGKQVQTRIVSGQAAASSPRQTELLDGNMFFTIPSLVSNTHMRLVPQTFKVNTHLRNCYKPVKVRLPPESTVEFMIPLLEELYVFFWKIPPGEYKVSLEHNRSGIQSPECTLPELLLKSNEVTIKVVQPDAELDRPPTQLQMRLAPPKEPFVEGEPIILKVSVTNTSEKDGGLIGFDMLGRNSGAGVDRVGRQTGLRVDVEPAPAGVKTREQGTEYRALQLPPKSTGHFDLDLLKVAYAPEKYPPGEYKLSLYFSWTRTDGTGKPGSVENDLWIHSNEITVRVVPGKKADGEAEE